MAEQIASAFVKVGADVDGFNKAMDGVGNRMGGLGKVAGAAFSAVAAAATVAGTAVVATIAKSVSAAGDLEQSAANIAAVFGDMAPPIADVKAQINALALDPSLVVGVQDAGAGLEMLAKNGLTWEQIAGGAARSTILLANATGADLASSADIATNAMGIFGMGVEDLDSVVATFTNAANKSQFDINDWGYVLANAGPAANALGYDLEELFAAVTLTSSGFASGREGGTSWEYLMKGLTPSTQVATDAMKELGLMTAEGANQFFNADGSAKPLSDTLAILQGAFGKLSQEQRMAYSETIFGNSAYGALEGVLGMNLDTLKELTPTMTDFSAVEKGAATRTNTFQAAMAAVGDTINSVFAMIGDEFLPLFTQMARTFAAFVKDNAEPIIAFFSDFADGLSTFVSNAGTLLTRLNALFSVQFAILGSENASWGEKMLAIWDMLYVVGLEIWQSLLDGLVNLVPQWLAGLGEWAKGIWQWIVDSIPLAVTKLGEWAGALWAWLIANLPTWAENLWEWAKATWAWIVEVTPLAVTKLGEWATALWGWLTTNLPTWVDTLATWGRAAWEWLAVVVPLAVTKLGDWGNALYGWLITNAPTWGSNLAEWGTAAWQWIVDATPGAVTKLGEWAGKLFEWLGQNLPSFIDNLKGWAQGLWQWIVDVIPETVLKLGDWGAAIWQWLVANGPPIFDKLDEWGTALWTWIQEAFGPVVTWLGNIAAEFLSWKDIVGGVILALGIIFWPTIAAAFGAIMAGIGGFIAAWAPVIAIFVAAIAAVALLRNAWERDWGGIQTNTLAALNFVKEAFGPLLDTIKQFGGQALQEIITWATGNATNFEATKRIWEAAKLAFGTVFDAIAAKLVEWGTIAWEWLKENFPNAAAALMLAVDNIKRNFAELWTAAEPLIQMLKDAWAAFTKDAETQGGLLGVAMKKAQTVLDGVWTIMVTAAGFAINTIINLITMVIQLINGDWEGAWTSIKQIGKGAWDTLVTIVRTAIDTIARLFGYSIKDVDAWARQVKEKIMALVDKAWNWGRDLVEGFWKGAQSAWNGFKSWWDGIWGRDVPKTVSVKMETHSPSKVMEQFGKWTMQGFGIGAEKMMPYVEGVMAGLPNAALAAGEQSGAAMQFSASGAGTNNEDALLMRENNALLRQLITALQNKNMTSNVTVQGGNGGLSSLVGFTAGLR